MVLPHRQRQVPVLEEQAVVRGAEARLAEPAGVLGMVGRAGVAEFGVQRRQRVAGALAQHADGHHRIVFDQAALQLRRGVDAQVDDPALAVALQPHLLHVRGQPRIALPMLQRRANGGAGLGQVQQHVPLGRLEGGEQVQADGRVQLGRLQPQLFQPHQVVLLQWLMLVQVTLQHPAEGAAVHALGGRRFGRFGQIVVRFAHGGCELAGV